MAEAAKGDLEIRAAAREQEDDLLRNPSDDESEDGPDHPYIEPAGKIQMLYQAGLRFEANGAWELADQSYRQALKLLTTEDKEKFNALRYRLDRVSESLGNNEEAEEHYNAVAGNDCATPEPQ